MSYSTESQTQCPVYRSLSAGWMCNAVPSVDRFSDVEVLLPGAASWSHLAVPNTVKALVVVNLQSYAGGRNIWGPKMKKSSIAKHGWTQPVPSDGVLEVRGGRGLHVFLWRS